MVQCGQILTLVKKNFLLAKVKIQIQNLEKSIKFKYYTVTVSFPNLPFFKNSYRDISKGHFRTHHSNVIGFIKKWEQYHTKN